MDKLLDQTSEINYGCLFASYKFSLLCYADDNALKALSSYGMQQLIDCLC